MAVDDARTVGRHRRLADSDSDDEPQTVLTLAKASDLCPKPYRLVARSQNITNLADLSSLTALDYIDLTSNALTSLDGIHHPRLKTLIVANNNLTQLKPVYKSSTIRILNVSNNRLPGLDWLPHTAFAAHLLTLVASSNSLHALTGLTALSSLQTLVISNNEIEDITPISHLLSLVKLSASGNRIRTLPSLASLEHLSELRLAHNRIDKLPECRVPTLKILDMGHNRLSEIDSIGSFAPALVQTNLRKNPVCERSDLHEFVKGLCARLEVIDGRRVAGGRRKVRVNRIRNAVGFEIEHDRKFARLPSEYYLKSLKEKDLEKEDEVKQSEMKRDAKRKRGTQIEDEEEVIVDAEKFVEMARVKTQNGSQSVGFTVKVHHQADAHEGKRQKRKKRNRDCEALVSNDDNFGDGGTSRW